MAIRSTGLLGATTIQSLVSNKNTLTDLQRQLGTGQKSATYGGLGTQATQALDYLSQISAMNGFSSANSIVSTRLSLLDSTMNQLQTVASSVNSALRTDEFSLSNGQTLGQASATNGLDEAIGALNTELDGRYFFAGKDTGTAPVQDTNTIMNGSGGKDGFKTVAGERLAADLGGSLSQTDPTAADYPTGRLTGTYLSTPVTTASTYTATLAEDGAHSFGMKFDTGTAALPTTVSGTIAGLSATVSSTSGAKSLSLTLTDQATQPSAGQTLSIPMTLPDGTKSSLTLSCVDSTATTLQPGQFKAGATSSETMANIQNALKSAQQDVVRTDLASASAAQAGNDFFKGDSNGVPIRITGGSATNYTATAFDSAASSAAKTVSWYVGGTSSSPRETVTARVDSNVTIKYGAQANETALRSLVQNLAVMSSQSYSSSDKTAQDRYNALISRTKTGLTTSNSAGTQTISSLHMEVAIAQTALKNATTRQTATKAMMQDMYDTVQGVDNTEVSAQILTLQTQLQASYQTSSMLSKLSLVNYM